MATLKSWSDEVESAVKSLRSVRENLSVGQINGRLDVYIYDYLLKRKLHSSTKAFMAEGKVVTDHIGWISL
nr:transcriptional corepressor LEUNIG_homolog isoform X1 [Tanacetum cinerariifolium]